MSVSFSLGLCAKQKKCNAVNQYRNHVQQLPLCMVYRSTNEVYRSTNEVYRSTNEVYRSTNEVYRSPNEVYRSTNEVYRSTNEVYRSTNEVYRSPNEVYRSTNEVYRSTNEVYRSPLRGGYRSRGMQLNGGTGLFFHLILHPPGVVPQNDNNDRRREWTVLVISTGWPLTPVHNKAIVFVKSRGRISGHE
ncbi:unnamed protein product [Arctogadus glacialis]